MTTITIITAVYNNAAEIGCAIESVLSQSYQNIEYIIIDGGSTDGTQKVIQSYGNRITQFSSEPDKGIYDALNKGIQRATGDIIGFLHSDDIFDNENVVSKISEYFLNDNCDATYGDLVYVGKADSSMVIRYWRSCNFELKKFKHGWMPAHPTLFLKKEVYQKFGMFNIHFKIAADYDFILRTLGGGTLKCSYIPMIITRMRTGGASNKSLKNIWEKSYEDWQALRKNKSGGIYTLLSKNFSKLEQFIKKSPQ